MSYHRYSKYLPILFILTDLICLNTSTLIANYYYFETLSTSEDYKTLQFFLNGIWLIVFYLVKLHKVDRNSTLVHHLNRLLTGLVINLSSVFALWFALQPIGYSRKFLFVTYLFFTLFIFIFRTIWYYSIRYYRKKGYNIVNIVIIGVGDSANAFTNYLNKNPELGYKITGIIDDNEKMENFESFVLQNNTYAIFCCLPYIPESRLKKIIDFAENNLIKVRFIPQFSKLAAYNLSLEQFGSMPIVHINPIPLDNWINQWVKRGFDIVFSMVVIITILSWLIPIIIILIKLESKGPIFFMQSRHGKDNKLFKIYKFRSMRVHGDSYVKQATKKDPRVTKIGAVLRKTSIDELPQFINVLKGEMSVVGPRPHAIQHNVEHQPKIDRFWQRHVIKPGITGLAQAKGFRGETATHDDMSGRVRLDRFYIRNWSLLLDIKIILLTIVSIFQGNKKAY